MNIQTEILRMKSTGYSIEDTYIYLKDYVSIETIIQHWEGA